MRKVLTYTGFFIACLLVSLLFVTATTYVQLAVAVILYPVVAYFAMKLLPHRTIQTPTTITQSPVMPGQPAMQTVGTVEEEVIDFDKRTFLKLVGATGIFFFISSLLGRRADGLLFGKITNSVAQPATGTSSSNPSPDEATGSLATEGYNISEIDDNIISYYGFTNKDNAWYIMKEDTNTGSFRYVKGTSDFPGNWANRERLSYDYFNRVF